MSSFMFENAKRKFGEQRRNARRRVIDFNFTFEEWCDWWMIDDRWKRRGRIKGALVMARKGDIGPYSPENTICIGHRQNIQQVDRSKHAEKYRKAWEQKKAAGWKPAVEMRGDGHPRARAVITPEGRFGSTRLAAEHFGISVPTVGNRIRGGIPGWSWE